MKRYIAILFALVLFSSPAHASWLDSVKGSLNTIKSGIDAVQGTAPKSKNDNGNTADEPEKDQPSKTSKKKAASRAAESESEDESRPAADAPAAGEVYSNKFDFVPGENVIFFDDFSDTDPGDYPIRWTLGEGGGPVEVVEYQGERWLKSIADGKRKEMKDARSFMRVDLSKTLPDKFTVEFDTPSTANLCVSFPEKYWATGADCICFGPDKVNMYWSHVSNDSFSSPKNALRHVSIAVSGTNVKVYFDGERVLLNPDGLRVRHKANTIGFTFPNGPKRQDLMITNFKFAEGGKDYAKELVSGRIVTHGITFDTGSDVLKPESGPTLRKILKLLQDNADLKFEVQGHTDNQGSDKVNGPLSEKRAGAVKTWLVKQGIDESRLVSKGLGSTKPIDKNDTPEGRANNRRVEFIKI